MAQVRGHSIEEQYDLSEQFANMVELAINDVVEQFLHRTALVAAGIPLDSSDSVHTAWDAKVDGVFASFLNTTYESSALELAHGVMNVYELPAGIGVPSIPDHTASDYVAATANKMKGISDDLWTNISKELAEGQAAGESIDELADRVRQAGSVTIPRAQATARTTVVAASNAGSYQQALLLADDNTMQKEWVATDDMRTRPDHAHADTQTVALTANFSVGGYAMAYPGDPTAPAGEVINCRCTLTYNFDGPPTHVCDCSEQGALALTAAGFVKSPVTVPSGSCICPATAAMTPPGYSSSLKYLDDVGKQDVFSTFQGPQKISPIYGGAKIHKQLDAVMKAYGLDAQDTQTILDIVDEQYKLSGGKSSFTFKEKYEEWLDSSAGKKTTSAIPKFASTPAVTTPTVTSFDPVQALSELSKKASDNHLTTLYQSLNVGLKYTNPTDTMIGVRSIAQSYGIKLGEYSDDELLQMFKEFADTHGLSTENIDKALGKAAVNPTAVTTPTAPVIPATAVTPAAIDPLDISMISDAQANAFYTVFKSYKPITPNWGGAAIYKNLQAIKPLLSSSPNLVNLNDGQLLKLLDKAYGSKGSKTYYDESEKWLQTPGGKKYAKDNGLDPGGVNPAPGSSAVPAVTSPVTVPSVAPLVTTPTTGLDVAAEIDKITALSDKYSVKQLANSFDHGLQNKPFDDIIGPFRDQAQNLYGIDLSAYTDDEVVEIFAQVGTDNGLNFPGLERQLKKIKSATASSVTTTATATAVTDAGDISALSLDDKKMLFNSIKSKGIYLTTTPSDLWDAVQFVKTTPLGENLNDLQILRVLDEQTAAKLGVTDGHLYEQKITKWLKTKPGKDYSSGIKPAHPVGYEKVDLHEIDRSGIVTTDETYSEISVNGAIDLQNTYAPWTTGERASLRYYTGSSYSVMNSALRSTDVAESKYARHIRKAQQGMRPSTRPLMLYRGTGLDALPGLGNYSKLSDVEKFLGKTVQDQGFMSTSVGGKPAFGGRLLIEFEAPTGTPMAFVDHISKNQGENEMLLAAGTSYRVISVKEVSGKIIMRVRIVPS